MKYAIYALVAVCLSTACTHYSEPILETMYEKGMLDNHDTIDPPALSSAELAPGYDREPARTEDRTCHFGVLTLNHAGWEEYVCAPK